MKKITLYNSSKQAMVSDEDYTELLHHNWYLHPRGYVVCYQRTARYNGRRCTFLHDFLMRPPDGMQVDHKDHNGLNCQRDNLRIATHSQNHGNKRKPGGKHTSKYKGVSWQAASGKWYAIICCQGKQYNLGRHDDETEAARAYDAKARELFGEFALTNFPE